MKFIRKLRILFLLLLVPAIWFGATEFQRYLHTPLNIREAQELDVAKGSTLAQVMRELSARGLLRHRLVLQVYVRITKRGNRIQAG
ncbi:MAG TPA: hypothetical protein VFM32_10655, partial [Spongiibacteraceae bacterium]|nr:hypothetical protein [Spongiibacteraceae bacterium]